MLTNTIMNSNLIGIILVIAIAFVLVYFLYWRKKKNLKYNCVALFTGAPKTGKTALCVKEVKRLYKSKLIKHYLLMPIKFIQLRNNEFKEYCKFKPMIYSNIPLRNTKFNKFTIDMLMREVRLPNGSIVLLDEASLIADSMLYKDKDINEKLMLFVKLFGHYTHGGYLIVNTQSIADLHFAFKRCVGSYYFITETRRYPFFSVAKVRECVYSEDNTSINGFNRDIEEDMKNVFIWNKNFKNYDCFCYSIFTDKLAYKVDYNAKVLRKKDSLKAIDIVTLQDFKSLKGDNFNA